MIFNDYILQELDKYQLGSGCLSNYCCKIHFCSLIYMESKRAFYRTLPHQNYNCFRLLLEKLSYNVSPKVLKEARIGVRYYNPRQCSFTWRTSRDGKFLQKTYDPEQKKYYDKEVPATFSDIRLSDHFLGCLRKARKIQPYYNLPMELKPYADEFKDSLVNMYYIHDKTLGSNQRLGTNIILIDIDNYKEDKAIDKLRTFLNFFNLQVSDLIYLEQNVFKGGIHTAIRIDRTINEKGFYQELEKFVKETVGIKIECQFIDKILRFPLSYEYMPVVLKQEVLNTDEYFDEKYYIKSFEDFVETLNEKVNYIPFEEYGFKYVSKLPKRKTLDELRQSESKKKFIKRPIIRRKGELTPIKKRTTFYKITEGNRWETQKKIVPYCKAMGYTLDETVDIIIQQTVSSKDIEHNGREFVYNNIKDFYNKIEAKPITPIKPNYYISNYNNIPEQTLRFLLDPHVQEEFSNRFIQNYIKVRSQYEYFTHLSDEKQAILRQIIPLMVIEIVGKMFYELSHPKEFVSYIHEQLGFQIPDNFLKGVQQYCLEQKGIDSPIGNTSLNLLKRAIVLSMNLSQLEMPYRHNRRNWRSGSCKSYRICSTHDLTTLIRHWFNSMFQTSVHKNYIMRTNVPNYRSKQHSAHGSAVCHNKCSTHGSSSCSRTISSTSGSIHGSNQYSSISCSNICSEPIGSNSCSEHIPSELHSEHISSNINQNINSNNVQINYDNITSFHNPSINILNISSKENWGYNKLTGEIYEETVDPPPWAIDFTEWFTEKFGEQVLKWLD